MSARGMRTSRKSQTMRWHTDRWWTGSSSQALLTDRNPAQISLRSVPLDSIVVSFNSRTGRSSIPNRAMSAATAIFQLRTHAHSLGRLHRIFQILKSTSTSSVLRYSDARFPSIDHSSPTVRRSSIRFRERSVAMAHRIGSSDADRKTGRPRDPSPCLG